MWLESMIDHLMVVTIRVSRQRLDLGKPQVVSIQPGTEDGSALRTSSGRRFDLRIALMTIAQQVGQPRRLPDHRPQLAGGRTSDHGVSRDLSAIDHFDQTFIGHATPEWVFGITYEPGAHAILDVSSRKGIKIDATTSTTSTCRLGGSAIRTYHDLFISHPQSLSLSVMLVLFGASI